ncbi:MAG: hypothetical protein VB036_05550 [Propionicimonas sp.]|nr:hypothetical protein [Propionicimonas sp.]
MRHGPAILAAALVLLAAGPVAPASAAPAETCTGVWVVVDASTLGGPVSLSCATDHTTGTEALASAGVEIVRSSSMLCQLNGLPEECSISATAYWSYWQAAPSGDSYGAWTYASLGPDSYHPRGGDAEGWVFGDGRTPPSALPTTLAQPGPGTTTTATAPAQPEPTPQQLPAPGSPRTLIIVVGLVVLVAIALWIARRRRP